MLDLQPAATRSRSLRRFGLALAGGRALDRLESTVRDGLTA
jgi:hypothetical protein